MLGIYIALSVACGLYLLGVYRLPHDHGAPSRSACRDCCSASRSWAWPCTCCRACSRRPWKTGAAACRSGRSGPTGPSSPGWTSFLLPEAPRQARGNSEFAWVGDLRQGLQEAKAENKLVFLDFTAETCTNCKYNEASIFTKPEVKNRLEKYVLVHLYTDKVPPEYDSSTTGPQNQKLQADAFGNDQLPLYAILKPIDDGGSKAYLVGQPYKEGKINDVNGFTKYLQQALDDAPEARAEAKGG